jgi:hypothetical protein
MEKVKKLLLGIHTDLDRLDPDQHSRDVDPDPAKSCGSDPIRIQIHNTDIISSLLANFDREYSSIELFFFFNTQFP